MSYALDLLLGGEAVDKKFPAIPAHPGVSIESDAVFPESIERAAERMGHSTAERLQWALNLAQENIAAWTPGDRKSRLEELEAFLFVGMWEGRFATPETDLLNLILADGDLLKIRQEFLRILDGFAKQDHARIGPFNLTYAIVLPRWLENRTVEFGGRRTSPRGRGSLRRFDESWRQFTQNKAMSRLLGDPSKTNTTSLSAICLAELLCAQLSHLRQCLDTSCGRWFVAMRKNQEYCSRAHAMRTAKRAQRARNKGGGRRRTK